ncbi:MAG: hypothetical protein O3B13_14910 [Planctomycetota bacterium]|nr:hypothetical protein [Planctomycetota bacterium]
MSRTIFFLLTAILIVASCTGCSGLRAHQSAATNVSKDVVFAVRAERDSEVRGPIVAISQELEAPSVDEEPSGTVDSIWAKLRSPTRFLLPRTDSNGDTAESSSPAQGLDEGF